MRTIRGSPHNGAAGDSRSEPFLARTITYVPLAFGTAVAIGLGTAVAITNSYSAAAGRFRITVPYRKEPKCLRLPMP